MFSFPFREREDEVDFQVGMAEKVNLVTKERGVREASVALQE